MHFSFSYQQFPCPPCPVPAMPLRMLDESGESVAYSDEDDPHIDSLASDATEPFYTDSDASSEDDYIKSLEEYKVLTDEHIVTLKELIEAHKTHSTSLEEGIKIHKEINEVNEKIIEEYKNAKPSRF